MLAPSIGYADPSVDTLAGNTGITYDCAPVPAFNADGSPSLDANHHQIMLYGECTYADLIRAVSRLTSFVVTYIALLFSVVVIAYAGFLYMTSGGNQPQLDRAHSMFIKIAWGLFWVLAAWLIVTLITNSLLTPAASQAVPLTQ